MANLFLFLCFNEGALVACLGPGLALTDPEAQNAAGEQTPRAAGQTAAGRLREQTPLASHQNHSQSRQSHQR